MPDEVVAAVAAPETVGSPEAAKDPILQAIMTKGEEKSVEKPAKAKEKGRDEDNEPEGEIDRDPEEEDQQTVDESSDADDEQDGEEETDETETKEELEEETQEEEEDDGNYDDYIDEVVVDGEAMEVSLKDLKSNFSANKYIQKNIQVAVEERKKSEEIRNTLFSTYEHTYNQLSKLSGMLNELAEPGIDWDRLRNEDPQTFLIKREEQRELQSKQQAVNQEAERVRQKQAKLRADAMAELTHSEARLLTAKLPELKNPTQGKKLKERFVSAAAKYGYTPDEIGTVIDHRALLALNDAAKWQEHVAKREQVRESGKKNGVKDIKLKPTKASTPAASSKRLVDKLRNRAIRTGKPDDVAATLLVRK